MFEVTRQPDRSCLLTINGESSSLKFAIFSIDATDPPRSLRRGRIERIGPEARVALKGAEPDVVMACAGDVPTLETLAAVKLLREHVDDPRVRVINVLHLMQLQPPTEHPHGLDDKDFDTLFTKDRMYRRPNHKSKHALGYKEEGPSPRRSEWPC